MLSRDCQATDEIFTHIDPDNGRVRHFNASAMGRAIPGYSIIGKVKEITAYLDPEFVQFIKEKRGVEQWKIARLTAIQLQIPVIGVRMPDDSVLLVDGHHRLVALHNLGKTDYDINIFNLGSWEEFLVEDLPAEVEAYALGSLS